LNGSARKFILNPYEQTYERCHLDAKEISEVNTEKALGKYTERD
jgi:hypothetical protein